jgi:GNAT superfamily N-acetyltransferase
LEVERATKEDYDEVLASLPRFWGARDVAGLHHPMFIAEFGDTALIIRDRQRGVAAYLFGFVVAAKARGYVHLVAVREDHRGLGLGRSLYAAFERLALTTGCREIKAITTPANAGSIAFHEALGMQAVEIEDYAGIGHPRVVLTRPLANQA